MSALITKHISVLDEFRLRGQVQPRALSVGGIKPFKGRPLSVGAATAADTTGQGQAGVDMFCGGGCNGPEGIKKFLDKIGYPPCRLWGAEAPGGRDALGCPVHKKLCIINYPMRLSVAFGTTVTLEFRAKVWFWPLMAVDGGSGADITVDDMTYTGDPVQENGTLVASTGTATRSWSPSSQFPPEGNYSLMPGLPAIDGNQGIILTLSNGHASADEDFAMNFLGVSIRN